MSERLARNLSFKNLLDATQGLVFVKTFLANLWKIAEIRAARGLLDISQAELALRSGVGLATIRRIENSRAELRVTVQVLLRLQRRTLAQLGDPLHSAYLR